MFDLALGTAVSSDLEHGSEKSGHGSRVHQDLKGLSGWLIVPSLSLPQESSSCLGPFRPLPALSGLPQSGCGLPVVPLSLSSPQENCSLESDHTWVRSAKLPRKDGTFSVRPSHMEAIP